MLFNTLTRFFLFSIVTLISISTGLASGDSAEITTSSDTSTDGSAQSFSELNELNLFYENGTLALENEDFEEAILNFDKALRIDPNHTSSLIKKGDALAMLGENDMSLSNYDRALEIEPKNEGALIAKARIFYDQGKYEESIDHVDKLLLINSDNMVFLTLKGAALAAMGKSEEAIPYFDKALDYYPNYIDALINKGAVLSSLGRHLEAKPYLEKALDLAPEDYVALANLGAAYVNVNRPHDAVPFFMKGLEKNPDTIVNLNGLGAALTNVREYDQAILYLNRTLAIDPNNAFALSVKGTALVGQEKYERAISFYEKALETNPDDEITIKNLALAKEKLEFKPFVGNAEIFLRDSDGGLVGFLYASSLVLENATIAQQMLDISPKKKIIRDGQEFEITTMKQLGNVRFDTVLAKTFIYGQKGQPFIQTMHWGYPVEYGDTINTIYVISRPVQ